MRGAAEAVAVACDVASSSPSNPAPALEMMRLQRPTPDCVPLPNGIGSGSSSTGVKRMPPPPPPPPPAAAAAAPRSGRDDVAPAAAPTVATDSSRLAAFLASTSLEPKPRARALQPPAPVPTPSSSSSATAHAARSPARDQGHHCLGDPNSPSSSGSAAPAGGEVLLQWGQNKRSRGRRDASAGASPQRRQSPAKIQRRSSAPADKLMPPPSAPSLARGSTLRVSSSLPAARAGDQHHSRGALLNHRSAAEERAAGKSTAGMRAEKQRKGDAGPVMGLMVPDPKQMMQHHHKADHHGGGSPGSSAAPKPKPKQAAQRAEFPRIFTTLSRKEKEDDFMAIKGAKLPQRPKKRPKTVEKAVNFVCPGMWLTDVTRSRYVVREKRSTKKAEAFGPERAGENGQRIGLIFGAHRAGA
ncbi:hypothetical protein ACP4OV_021226 [Aristida adscensionis]